MDFTHFASLRFQSLLMGKQRWQHCFLSIRNSTDILFRALWLQLTKIKLFFLDCPLVLLEFTHQLLVIDIEHQELLLVLLYFIGMQLDILQKILLFLEKDLLLIGTLFLGNLMVDILLDLSNLLIEGGNGGNDAIKFCIPLARDEVRQLLIEFNQLRLAQLIERSWINDVGFFATTCFAQFGFFHRKDYNSSIVLMNH